MTLHRGCMQYGSMHPNLQIGDILQEHFANFCKHRASGNAPTAYLNRILGATDQSQKEGLNDWFNEMLARLHYFGSVNKFRMLSELDGTSM